MILVFFTVSFITQLFHSAEELSTGFHKQWYLFKMPFYVFLTFEIVFTTFWLVVLLVDSFPFRTELMAFFLILMFANGIQHIVWGAVTKKYVPGLVTACFHIGVFIVFYFTVINAV